MEQDVNLRSQLAAACRDKDFGEARHLLAAGANPKGSTCGFFNWTALHFCCQHGELAFAKELIETYGINPEAEDKEGRTPLHIACQFGHIHVAQYLTSQCKCDPDYLDFEEQTPLHHAVGWLSECSEQEALKVAEFLILTAQCDPHRRDMNGKNALLHTCEKGFLAVAQYLVDKCGSNVTDIDTYGNSCLHLAISYANNLQMVQYLVTNFPGSISSPSGNTILHAACAASSNVDIVKYLLTTVKCDPNFRNEKGIQPLDLTTKKEIKRLLYMHGASPDNVLEKHGNVLYSTPKTHSLKPALKVLVLGKHSSGKTTMIKAFQREGSSLVFSFSGQRTSKYEEHTRGLQISEFQGKGGCFSFYDFAGKEEYRTSHSALLHHILYRSAALIVLVVNLCESIEDLKRQLFEWMSIIDENSSAVKAKLDIIVVGSHNDVVKGDVSKIWKELNVDQQCSRNSKLEVLASIALDCQRSESQGMTKLRQHLDNSYQRLYPVDTIHFNAQCLYDVLETRYIGTLAMSVRDLCQQVSVSDDSNISASQIEYFIPNNEQLLTDLCVYMNDVGLAMYLHSTDSEKSFVVVNRQLFLNIIATAFTPSADDSRGMICLSTLLPQKCDTDLVADLLVQLEVCQTVPNSCIIVENGDQDSGDEYMYFPALARVKLPNSVWDYNLHFKCHFGWTLRFGTMISARLIEILLVRMCSTFFRTSRGTATQFRCWNNGIIGLNEQGYEFIAEIKNGAVLIIIRSTASNLPYLKLRSQLINVCRSAVHELCHGVVTEELFIDPFEAVQYPLKPPSFIAHFTFTEAIRAIMDKNAMVKSTTGDELLVKDLIGHDPYIDLGPELARHIFKDLPGDSVISDEYMGQLSSVLSGSDYFTELFLIDNHSPSFANSSDVLRGWCGHAGETYQSLRQVLDQASVFSSRSVSRATSE